jgi:hypothetical protein
MKKIYTILLYITLSITLNSCAMIFNRHPNKVFVNSYPDSAQVFLNNTFLGFTPTYLEVDGKQSTYSIILKMEGYENRNLIVENKTNSFLQTLDLILLSPYIISTLSGYNYEQYTLQNDYIFLKYNDTIKKPCSRNFGDNFIMVEGIPLISILGGLVTLETNYYNDLFKIKESEESLNSIGVKGGWGYGVIALGDIKSEGFGYNIMPSYAYENFTDFDDYQDKSCKYIFSIGFSYSQKIDRPSSNYPYGSKYNLYRGILPSFSFQNITMYYEKRIFWGYSLGYVNAVNFFQFSFGYRF